MKIGLSTYSLLPAINSGELDVLGVIQWIADNGGEHVEIVPFGYKLMDNDSLIEDIRKKTQEVGIEISNYAILANVLQEDRDDYENEIKRLKKEVDIANKLGVKTMRHDVSAFRRPAEQNTIIHFEKDLPRMVEACQRVADYAAKYGITTTVENHGFYVNGSDRVIRLIHEADRPNFKMTLDVGNFMCVDEDSTAGVKKALPYSAMIHLKDFYLCPSYRNPGGTTMFDCAGKWFTTVTGNFLRGAIVGQGDMDMYEILRLIKESGYNGYISIEFEGMENCYYGSRVGMDNTRRILNEV
jgi:inosose dehydratase